MKRLHINTPLLHSLPLSQRAGTEVYLKLDLLQPSGSFKLRGIGHACQHYAQKGARRFLSSSGGNAGLAVAYAGRKLGLPVLVAVPRTTSERAMELIRQQGANLVVHGESWQEANAHALSLLHKDDAFIHPFDDPLLWQGHSNLIEEVADSGFRPEAILLSVGGGGLLCGILEGLERQGWADIPVLAVETAGADSLAKAVTSGFPVELPAITSIATSLGARQVCTEALERASKYQVRNLVVSDRQAVEACLGFLDDHRMLVEPACGATLALPYFRLAELEQYRNILVVVCGGATTTASQLWTWAKKLQETGA